MTESVELPTLGLTEGVRFGFGFRDTLVPAAPAAGASAVATFDNQYGVRILSVQVQLTTSAVVANRQLRATLADQNGLTFWDIIAPVTQAASLTQALQLVSGYGVTYSAFPASVIMPIPDQLLPSSAKLTVSASAIDPGDQIIIKSIFVEKFPIGKWGYYTGTRRISVSEQ